jgi:hypothetical protein
MRGTKSLSVAELPNIRFDNSPEFEVRITVATPRPIRLVGRSPGTS